jgi:hypothetical protein
MYKSLTENIIDLFSKNSFRKFLLTAGLLPLLFMQTDSLLSIINQPLPQTDCYGNLVQFSISVSGSAGTLTFQWQRRPPSGTFTDMSGENSSTLSVYNIGMYGQNTDGTEYRVIVSDDNGSTISDPAVLHINSITNLTPAIVNSTICSGGNITYTASSQGSALSYQWESNTGSGWEAISDNSIFSGTNTPQLTISNATTAQNGSYRISITFSTLNQPASDPTCIETSFTRTRNLVVRPPLLTSPIYHR